TACEQDGVRVRDFGLDYCSHAFPVDRVRDRLLQVLAGIRPRTGDIPFYSTVATTPEWSAGSVPALVPVDGARLDAKYWYQNLRHPVILAPVIAGLARPSGALIEVGPHPVLSPSIETNLPYNGVVRPTIGPTRHDTAG